MDTGMETGSESGTRAERSGRLTEFRKTFPTHERTGLEGAVTFNAESPLGSQGTDS